MISVIASEADPSKIPEENGSTSFQSINKVNETLKKICNNYVIEEEEEYQDEETKRKKAKKDCLVDDYVEVYGSRNSDKLKDVIFLIMQLIGGKKYTLLTCISEGHMHRSLV